MSPLRYKNEFRLYGIFGYPLSHTLSPVMHEAAFASLGIKAYYLAFELDRVHFPKASSALSDFLLEGFNVTVPYKEALIPYLDELTDEARAIGAVNTVFRRGRKWIGTNTDQAGFSESLRRAAGFHPAGKKILILGAGGSARAAAYALAREGAELIRIANRHPARAEKIARDFKSRFKPSRFKAISLGEKNLRSSVSDSDLVVNATSVGLRGETSVLAPALFPKDGRRRLFFDLIYRPARTPFLKLAEKSGNRTLGGLEMLLYQGARSLEIWTARKAPVPVMRKALAAALKEKKS